MSATNKIKEIIDSITVRELFFLLVFQSVVFTVVLGVGGYYFYQFYQNRHLTLEGLTVTNGVYSVDIYAGSDGAGIDVKGKEKHSVHIKTDNKSSRVGTYQYYDYNGIYSDEDKVGIEYYDNGIKFNPFKQEKRIGQQ